MNVLNNIKKEQVSNKSTPSINVGDIVTVKSRYCKSSPKYSVFTGECIAIKSKLFDSKILLRGRTNKQYIEREYPIYSSLIEYIKTFPKHGNRVHKSKLYYRRANS